MMRAILLFLPCLLAACAPLRPEAPSSTPASLYSDLSARFAEGGDATAAGRFAVKSLAAARQDTLTPDDPGAILPASASAEQRSELADNRTQLLAADTGAARRAMPEIAAQAEAYYDGWLAQAARGGDAPYKDDFQRALATLESAPGTSLAAIAPAAAAPVAAVATPEAAVSQPPAAPVAAPAPAATPERPAEAEPAIVVTYLVHFDWNRDTLNPEAAEVMEMVLTDLHNVDRYDLVLNGHADTTGRPDYNLDLSMRRAQHVAAWLKQSGVPDERITTYAFGDTDPKVETGPNIRSEANRRVEVVIE